MRLLAVTGSRADWGLLAPLLRRLRDDERFELLLAITGQHLEQGATESLREIARAGFQTTHQIDMGLGPDDGRCALTAAMGRATAGIGVLVERLEPDMMLVLGDRYEILAAVSAALMCRLPVAHLCGGDVTEGAMDDAIRHAITKLSSLHFVTTEVAARRVAQLGENPERIFNVGSTGLDQIRETELIGAETLWSELGLLPAPQRFLVAFHPATLTPDSPAQVDALVDALACFPQAALIVTGSNADPGARRIDERLKALVAARSNAVFQATLGSRRFLSALRAVDVLIGNSSSGIYEAPSFGIPTVNIGDRQARRVRAASVIDCDADRESIVGAIRQALASDWRSTINPYGDGHSAARIVDVLAGFMVPSRLVAKRFVDIAI